MSARFAPPRTLFRLACLSAALGLGGVLASPAVLAQAAASAQREFRVPAGPLSTALGQFGAQSGLLVASDPSLTDGVASPGVQGAMSSQEALRRLLAGTGLEAEPSRQGGWRLRRAGQSVTLAPVTVTGNYARPPADSYTAPDLTIGKFPERMKDIPQSVSVITRQRMDDQVMTSLPDAINNTTGMVGVQGVGLGIAINARGFPVDMLQYDGVALLRNSYSLGNWEQESMAFYERAEILRGAAGLLQGAGSPGGAVNLVRTRAGDETAVVVTGKVGSWDHYGLQLDAGSPLNAEGTLRGRVVLDEDRGHSYTDYVWNRTRNLYAALDYDLTADTTVGFGVANRDSRGRPMIVGLPRYADGSDIGLPRSTFTGSTWNRSHNEQTTFFADLEHRFNQDWRLKLAGAAMNESNTTAHQRAVGPVNADGSGLDYGDFGVDFTGRQRGADLSLLGRFELFGMKQEIVAGASVSRFTTNDRFARAWTSGGNIFDIDHHRPWQDIDTIADRGVETRSRYKIEQQGLYGTWRVKPTDALTLIGGGRVGWYDFLYEDAGGYASTSKANGKFIPYVGIVYALNPEWSLYTSYSTVFEPQTARSVDGGMLKPVEGKNYEAGVKGELADGRLNVSLAVFQYLHKNRAVNDYEAGFACDGWYCSRASGKVRSQGFEAEASGEVAPGLELFAGYTYNTTKYLSDPDYEGQVFNTWTPRHLLRLWANYRLPGSLNRLSVGAGTQSQSHTLASDRSFTLPGFTVWNARVAYKASSELTVALNVNNLFDKKYYIPSYNSATSNNHYGDPRNIMLTFQYAPKF
jgi:iron complex outermembrane receptor protein/outer membrane receptor for ferric coprogen and ferric-rhodotorulic acid